jgi:hypothetical protein
MASLKVRLLSSIAGDNYAHGAGEEITLDSAEAKRFLDAGLAEPVATRTAAKAEKRVTAKTEKR